jgi:hypothetical protein
MIELKYQKRKNTLLFKTLEKPNLLNISNPQNFIPIYNKIFSLNDSNYNTINLNHKFHLYSVKKEIEQPNLFNCILKKENDLFERDVFFKITPLLDPIRFLVGKFDNDNTIYHLPPTMNCHEKINDINNSSYVEGIFIYLSSCLLNNHNFHHGIDFYGSFLGIKNDFHYNIYDDIDHLVES